MNATAFGKVRGKLRDFFSSGDERAVALGSGAEQIVINGLGSDVEIARQGLFYVRDSGAVAAVTAIPTTAAHLTLQNGEDDGGKSYVIHSVFGIQSGNGAALNSWHIVGMIERGRVALKTRDITAISGTMGQAYGGAAIVDQAATVVNSPGLWFPLGNSAGTTVASLTGTALDVAVNGMIILPPGRSLSLATVASATGITVFLGFRWYEYQLELHGL